MDCYYVTGIITDQDAVQIRHCSNSSVKCVTAESAIDAAKVGKLKGFINGMLVPCFESNGIYVQDYYFCNHVLYHWVNWKYHEVFPRVSGKRFSVYVIKGFLVVAGSSRYVSCKLVSGSKGYSVISAEIFERGKYDLILVQSIKTDKITVVGNELYKITSNGLLLVRSTNFVKYDKIIQNVNLAIQEGKSVNYDAFVSKMQKLDVTDDGKSIYLDGEKIY